MKKEIEELKTKTVKELTKLAQDLRVKIAKLQLENKVNKPKDTNILTKEKKRLARVLTVLTEKQELEKYG